MEVLALHLYEVTRGEAGKASGFRNTFSWHFRPEVAALRRPLVRSKLLKQIECRYTHQSAAHKNTTRAHCQVQTLSSEGTLIAKDANCHIQARKDEQQASKREVNP